MLKNDRSPRNGDSYRHVRRDTWYTVVGQAILQTDTPLRDDAILVIYEGDDGRLWARPIQEFCDGRFESRDRDSQTM